MTRDQDIGAQLADQVRDAAARSTAVEIVGGGTKRSYGRPLAGEPLAMAAHRGIVSYEPTELVITARAGTPLSAVEATLAGHNQMLAFEPPHLGDGATLGGTIACGLSGPRRPYAGAARDYVLGARVINGRGEILAFGGQVMKNVAGYDAARLMVGAQGGLGAILEVSLKVLPRPAEEQTLVFELTAAVALEQMNRWAATPLPLSAACHYDGRLHVRLSGDGSAVRAARVRLGGEPAADGAAFWESIRERRHGFFKKPGAPLWRLSVPSSTGPMDVVGDCLLDWGGAQRWLRSVQPAARVRATASAVGGHATLLQGGDGLDVYAPLPPTLLALHQRLKLAFDPAGILNPGRLYAGL